MTTDLKEERFLLKGDAYIVDLANVDFLTWRKNEKENGTYWLKMHFSTKEARYICDKLEQKTTNFGKQQEDFNSRFRQLMEQKRKERKSRMVLGIWGEPKTGKTGIALDFPERKIYVLDWDSGVESTWIECHDAT